MANELHYNQSSGLYVYAVLVNATGQFINGTTPEAYNESNWANYAIAMPEGSNGWYFGNMPAVAAGVYTAYIFIKMAGPPVASDNSTSRIDIAWSGSAITVPDANDSAILAVLNKVDTMLTPSGANYQLTADALELAPSGSGSLAGTGSETVTITCKVGVVPIEGVAVWVTTDTSGINVVAGTLYSDALGIVTFYLDAGTYQLWKQGGANWTNPTEIIVTNV